MNSRSYLLLVFCLLVAMLLGCDPEEERLTSDPDLELVLSTDTVIFDTLLSSVGSITKRFKIYNPNKRAIEIQSLSIGSGDQSKYTITVNGVRGKSFSEEVVLGDDSLLVLVDVLIDPMEDDLPFLVKDSVVVSYNGNIESVKLVAWGQDANFLDGEAITCDAVWDSPRPYVIYNSALVDTLCSLTIQPGVRVYIDNDASLLVKGSLQILGSAEEKVIIRNTRLDNAYSIAPGQWNGIFFLEGSYDNVVDHAEIRNGQIGLRVGTPDEDDEFELVVSNTSIGHMSVAGIRAFTSDIDLVNCELFNCQGQLFGAYIGGNYRIRHCTFSNQPNLFSRDQQSVQFSDFLSLDDESTLIEDLNVELINSIVWGDQDEELLFAASGQANVVIEMNKNILRSGNIEFETLGNVISREDNYPGFISPIIYDYQIDSLSNSRDQAVASDIEFDLLGTLRDDFPDIGAYERKDSIP